MEIENLVTVRQLAEVSPAFTEAGIRWLLFQARSNGLERAIVRVGRRVLIDRVAFENWLEEGRVGAARINDSLPEAG